MALKVWVALTAPAAMAARVSAAVALEWPTETRTPRAGGVGGEFGCAGQLGSEGHEADVAFGGVEEAVEDGDVGREKMLGRVDAALERGRETGLQDECRWGGRSGLGGLRLGDELGQAGERAERRIEGGSDGGGEIAAGAARGEKAADGVEGLRAWLPSRRGRLRRGCGRRRMTGRGWRRGSRGRRGSRLSSAGARVEMETMRPSSIGDDRVVEEGGSVPELRRGEDRAHNQIIAGAVELYDDSSLSEPRVAVRDPSGFRIA